MKKVAVILSLAFLIIGFSAFQATAAPVWGEIRFGGSNPLDTYMTLDDTNWTLASSLSYVTTTITNRSGAFLSVPNPPALMAFDTIQFNPATAPGYFYLISDTVNFSYFFPSTINATIGHGDFATPDGNLEYLTLTLSGTGTVSMPPGSGYDPTPGYWELIGSQLIITDPYEGSPTYGKSILTDIFTFNARVWTDAEPVPEPSILLLLGGGLLGIVGLRRGLKK